MELPLNDQTPGPEARYRLIGIRRDGTSTTVLGSMTWDEATRARLAVDVSRIFASVHVVIDTGDDP